MRKSLALLAALILFALIGCTPKTPVTGLYADPVEPIVTPIHVEYGPGSQVLAYSAVTKINDRTVAMSFDATVDAQAQEDHLVSVYRFKDFKIKQGANRTSVDGTLMTATIETERTGEVIGQSVSSSMLNEKQLDEVKDSLTKVLVVNKLLNQDVTTGSVLFSAQEAMDKELSGMGFTLDGTKFEYVLAGYVMYQGEKALLARCDQSHGTLKRAGSGDVADFGISAYSILRPGNLQVRYTEVVVTASLQNLLDMTMSAVLREK